MTRSQLRRFRISNQTLRDGCQRLGQDWAKANLAHQSTSVDIDLVVILVRVRRQTFTH